MQQLLLCWFYRFLFKGLIIGPFFTIYFEMRQVLDFLFFVA